MKIVAAVFADFEHAPCGPARLREPLAGRPVLAHTLARVAEIDDVSARYLVVQARDRAAADEAAAGHAGIAVLDCDPGERPRRRLIRTARKWALDSWRGGLLGATWYDEWLEPRAAAAVLTASGADAVLCVEGHQPLLDTQLASDLLATQRERISEAEFIFDQAPPGLSGVVLTRGMVASLVESNTPLGILLAYRPEAPRMDLITKPMCRRIDSAVSQTKARFVADTDASLARLARAIEQHGPAVSAGDACATARAESPRTATLPIEVELELTTDDPLPDTSLRPRGTRVPQRAIEAGQVEQLAKELGAVDDRLVWLGGHGDPLRHPEFDAICRRLRDAGVFGLGLATPLVELSDTQIETLFALPVDVVEVLLDADSAETYQRVHNADGYERVVANIERLQAERARRGSPEPIVTCSMVRCAATFAEQEAFFDRWIRELGWAVLRGHRACDGLIAEDPLPGTTPLLRQPCPRPATRLMLLADGQAVACSEDPHGRQPLGRWDDGPLSAVWGAGPRADLLAAHAAGEFDSWPVCAGCRVWHEA